MRRFHGRFDKSHTGYAIIDGWKIVAIGTRILACNFIGDRFSDSQVDIRKGFDERFGVSKGQPRIGAADFAVIDISATVNLPRLLGEFQDQFVGMFLMPFQRSFETRQDLREA